MRLLKTDMLNLKILSAIFFVALVLSSCNTTKEIPYFQDVTQDLQEQNIVKPVEITIQPEDKLSIVVNSKDPQLAALFNLPIISRYVGETVSTTSPSTSFTSGSSQSQQVSLYTVNSNGDIDFPVLGRLHVEGMSKEYLAYYIKNELIKNNLIKDPTVTVEFKNLTISVLGEVKRPGLFNIDRSNITLLDGLSMAGDLTIYGKRENIKVIRKENNVQKFYTVNLCSAKDLYSSPVYYLQQNDVIYVEPNKTRARQSTVNGNQVLSTSFWVSLVSTLSTLILVLTN